MVANNLLPGLENNERVASQDQFPFTYFRNYIHTGSTLSKFLKRNFIQKTLIKISNSKFLELTIMAIFFKEKFNL